MKKLTSKLLPFLFVFVFLLSGFSVFSQNTTYDIVMCINGSGSVDEDDFLLQKQGMMEALKNTSIFPLDATRRFGLVQYGDGQTTVHVPLAFLTPQNIDQVISLVDNAVQLKGLTNPGDGLIVAKTMIENEQIKTDEQIICLSSDGVNISGTPLKDAVNALEAIEVDRFGVIGFDLGNDRTKFEDIYEPLTEQINGVSSVFIADNEIDFANIIGSGCAIGEIELVAMEVTQGIQNWNNDVFLVQGKKTFLRAFFERNSKKEIHAAFQFRFYKNGNLEYTSFPLILNNEDIPFDADSTRGDLKMNINLELPLNLEFDEVVLKAITKVTCDIKYGLTSDCKVNVEFKESPELRIGITRINWKGPNNEQISPETDLYPVLWKRFNRLLPIASSKFEILPSFMDKYERSKRFFTTPSNTFSKINNCIEKNKNELPNSDYYIGVIHQDSPTELGGQAEGIPSAFSSGKYFDENNTRGTFALVHELAHSLGLIHTGVNQSCTRNGKTVPNKYQGGCAECSDVISQFPYYFGNEAFIGKINSEPNEINWGFDVIEKTPVDPNLHFELMSYCGPNHNWVSDFTYSQLYDQLLLKPNFQEHKNIIFLKNLNGSYLVIDGILDFSSDEVFINPLVHSDVEIIGTSSSSELQLNTEDINGNLLASYFIELNTSSEDFDINSFLLTIPNDPNITKINFIKNSNIIHTIEKSSNIPTVSITSAFSTTTTIELTWEAEDLDGDDLLFDVQYSINNGQDWLDFAFDLTDLNYSVSLDNLSKSDQTIFRIVAKDGFNSAFSNQSQPFIIPNHNPILDVLSPDQNQTYYGTQLIFFEFITIDLDEGQIDPNMVFWTSNKDGALGSGEFMKKASELEEGLHTITTKAIDQDGGSTEVEKNIYIYRIRPANFNGSFDADGDGADVAVDCDDNDPAVQTLNNCGECAPPVADAPNITGQTTELCGDSINLLDYIVGDTVGEVRFGTTFGHYPYPISQKVKVLSDTTFYIIDSVATTTCFDTAVITFTYPTPDFSINPVSPLCLSDEPADLTLTNSPSGGFGGFCANGTCPYFINIDMAGELELSLSFVSCEIKERFIDKFPQIKIEIGGGDTVFFVLKEIQDCPNINIQYNTGLNVGSDIAMAFLPNIAEMAEAINCGKVLQNSPCPFDVSMGVNRQEITYIFLTKAEGDDFLDTHSVLSIEGRCLDFDSSYQVFYGPQEGINLIYINQGADIDDLQAVRATRCLSYPDPVFDPICWGIGKHAVEYKHEDEEGCYFSALAIVEVLNSPLILGKDIETCEGDTLMLIDFIDTSSMSSVFTSVLWDTVFPPQKELDTLSSIVLNQSKTVYYQAISSFNLECIDTTSSRITVHPKPDLEITLANGDTILSHYCANDAPFLLKGNQTGGRLWV
ncbi:MAG: vWA domain-containing protein, partial [Saprospiraceae bacterium]